MLRTGATALRIGENIAATALLALICSVTFAQVVFRFILKMPLAWSDELATFSFVWFALLGAAIAVREGGHIGVDALVRVLPKGQQAWVAISSLLLVQIFLLCLIKFGIDLLLRIGDQRSSGLQIQVFWVYLALPVSAILMFMHSLPVFAVLAGRLRGARSEEAGRG
jgi:TRAP-type C4-dicarboxylate transport system permease small subunit